MGWLGGQVTLCLRHSELQAVTADDTSLWRSTAAEDWDLIKLYHHEWSCGSWRARVLWSSQTKPGFTAPLGVLLGVTSSLTVTLKPASQPPPEQGGKAIFTRQKCGFPLQLDSRSQKDVSARPSSSSEKLLWQRCSHRTCDLPSQWSLYPGRWPGQVEADRWIHDDEFGASLCKVSRNLTKQDKEEDVEDGATADRAPGAAAAGPQGKSRQQSVLTEAHSVRS